MYYILYPLLRPPQLRLPRGQRRLWSRMRAYILCVHKSILTCSPRISELEHYGQSPY